MFFHNVEVTKQVDSFHLRYCFTKNLDLTIAFVIVFEENMELVVNFITLLLVSLLNLMLNFFNLLLDFFKNIFNLIIHALIFFMNLTLNGLKSLVCLLPFL
jgi:hypothetical protein